MTSLLLRRIYNLYDSGYRRPSPLFGLSRLIIKNRFAVRALFGMKVDASYLANGYFDLTTLLLKAEIRSRLRAMGYPRLLEIGVGRFAVLSGYFSRRVPTRITSCDYDPVAVESARAHVALNNLAVDVVQSDVLGAVAPREYDLMFWNLPELDDPEPALSRLFDAAPGYMAGAARLILGFDGRLLSAERARRILERYPALALETERRYSWNRHVLLIIKRT